MMINQISVVLVLLVLIHAAYRDYRTRHIHDLHWVLAFAAASLHIITLGYNVILPTLLLLIVGAALYKTGKWSSGDVLMLAALGPIAAVNIGLFTYALLIAGLGYMVAWKHFTGTEECPFIPGILAAYTLFQCLLLLGF